MLKRLLLRLFLSIALSAAIIVAADNLLFVHGTWNGWALNARSLAQSDLDWWQRNVGPLPKPPATSGFAAAPGVAGRDGTWYRGAGSGGSGGDTAPWFIEKGFLVHSIRTEVPLIVGRAMASDTHYGFGAGVTLPWIAIERTYSGIQGTTAPNPGVWHATIRPLGAIANLGVFTAIIAGPMLARDLFAVLRILQGRCSRCGYQLLTEQDRCPECGARRRFIVKPAADT